MSEVWDPILGEYVTREQRVADLKRELEALEHEREDN